MMRVCTSDLALFYKLTLLVITRNATPSVSSVFLFEKHTHYTPDAIVDDDRVSSDTDLMQLKIEDRHET